MTNKLFALCILGSLLFTSPAFSSSKTAGEIFGEPVSQEAYDFASKTISFFSLTAQENTSESARRTEIWNHLIFLHEAEKRGVVVAPATLENELKRLFQEKDITYGSLKYFEWVEKTFGEEESVVRRRVEDLLKIKSVIETIRKSDPSGQALQKLLDQANIKDLQAAAKETPKSIPAKTESSDPVLVFQTNQGNFEVRLFPKVAPKAVENMLGLAAKNYYDGIIFHRVIPGFMIQGGDPTGTGYHGDSLWGQPFEDETQPDVTFDKKGILAMANSGPNTNASQFFITLAPTPHLNGRHTIFGEIVSGMDVVEKIGKIKVGANDKPLEDQKMLKVFLKK